MTVPDRHVADRPAASSGRGRRSPVRHLATATEPDRQPDRGPVTHQITSVPDPDQQPGSLVRERAVDLLSGLRFVRNSPGSLLDQIAYAEDGAYSIQIEGWWRNVNVWYARLVAIPGLAVCYLIAWLFFTRLSRALVSIVVIPFVLMLLNGITVTAWLIPDWADFTTWWAAEPEVGAVG